MPFTFASLATERGRARVMATTPSKARRAERHAQALDNAEAKVTSRRALITQRVAAFATETSQSFENADAAAAYAEQQLADESAGPALRPKMRAFHADIARLQSQLAAAEVAGLDSGLDLDSGLKFVRYIPDIPRYWYIPGYTVCVFAHTSICPSIVAVAVAVDGWWSAAVAVAVAVLVVRFSFALKGSLKVRVSYH